MKGTDRYHVDGVLCRLDDRALRVVNMSVGGFFVECAEPLPRGTSARFELRLPDGRALSMTGLVTWINEPSAPRKAYLPPGFGVKIQRIAFPDKMTLLALLRESPPEAMRQR
ncbi:MAG TPA: PilZ domain-containing protein [Vicinamibacteria bacterium]|nr:PilZ domain-containing protein [Vicinamibacteria bacterium]